MRPKALLALLGAALIAAALYVPASSGDDPQRLSAGETVSFLYPATAEVGLPLGADPADALVYTGDVVGSTDGASCATGTFALQDAAVKDPRNPGAGESRLVTIATTVINGSSAEGTEVPPGTRLSTLVKLGSACTAGGVDYDRYTGVVQ